MKILYLFLISITFLLTPFSGMASQAPLELVILYTADVSGHTDPCG